MVKNKHQEINCECVILPDEDCLKKSEDYIKAIVDAVGKINDIWILQQVFRCIKILIREE